MHFCVKLTAVIRERVFFIFLQDGNNVKTEVKNYEMSATAIKDKSLLSSQAQQLCENIDAYWMTPVCDAAVTHSQRKFMDLLLVFIQFQFNSTQHFSHLSSAIQLDLAVAIVPLKRHYWLPVYDGKIMALDSSRGKVASVK